MVPRGGLLFSFFDFSIFCEFFFFVDFLFVFVMFFCASKKQEKTKKRRTASKRDERHGRSRHRPTKVLEFVKSILRP